MTRERQYPEATDPIFGCGDGGGGVIGYDCAAKDAYVAKAHGEYAKAWKAARGEFPGLDDGVVDCINAARDEYDRRASAETEAFAALAAEDAEAATRRQRMRESVSA